MRHLDALLTPSEVAELIAFDRMEPFGEGRADVRSALVAWTVASVMAGKRGRRPKLADFIPQWDKGEPKDAETLMRKVEMLNAALGGRDLRPKASVLLDASGRPIADRAAA